MVFFEISDSHVNNIYNRRNRLMRSPNKNDTRCDLKNNCASHQVVFFLDVLQFNKKGGRDHNNTCQYQKVYIGNTIWNDH